MASSPPARPEQPHLVSLVLQSKKALQHGEQLCSRANTLSNASSHCAIDVLALDAKVKWISEAVLEQLQLAAIVAKSIEEKRTKLEKQVIDWDSLRVQRADALDNVLESLGSQLVPPDFHQTSSDSSLFGSQHSDNEEETYPNGHTEIEGSPFHRIPSTTARKFLKPNNHADRKTWKTLRDFVDDRAIEEALDNMESDRNALDDILGTTDDYPETLNSTIINIRESLPPLGPPPSIEDVIKSQDAAITNMAEHLESLASHYDQMATALRDSEAGEAFSEEDLQEMNRDTDELPSIMAELEESVASIECTHDQLVATKAEAQEHIDRHHHTLDNLDELGEIMEEMLQCQQTVEAECEEHLAILHQHLNTMEQLHHRFLCFQASFSALILEITRRRQYREAAENIVKGMMSQLEAMTEEEDRLRADFNEEHGAHLPEDICLCVGNPPTNWEVLPCNGEVLEGLPDIPGDLVNQARDRISNGVRTRTI